MIKIEANGGECSVKMEGKTIDLLAEGMCVVKSLYQSYGNFKGANDDENFGKKTQEDFKNRILEHADDVFNNMNDDDYAKKLDNMSVKELLEELDKQLTEFLKDIEDRK